MSKHTRGPWRVDFRQWATGHIRFIMAGKYPVGRAESTRNTGAPGDSDANAYLMAAAPDLLAAINLFIAYDDDDEDVSAMLTYGRAIEAARAALAKVEGRHL